MKRLIVVEGDGLDVNIVRVVKDLGLGQYLTKLEEELNSTFEEHEIGEFGLGLGESGEYEGKKMRVFFTGPDDCSNRDWETDRKSTRLNSSHRL